MTTTKPTRKVNRRQRERRATNRPLTPVWDAPAQPPAHRPHTAAERQRLVREFLMLTELVMPDLALVELTDSFGDRVAWKRFEEN